jgi:hypothetical protein
MNAPGKLSITERIRARDGENCWCCGGKLEFDAQPNSKKAPTREHLVAQSLGGGNALDNLALCHAGCNRMLADKPLKQKQAIRAKMLANNARVAVKQTSAAPPSVRVAAPKSVASPPRAPTLAADARQRDGGAQLRHWQLFALASTGAALFSVGLALGLLAG